MTLQSDIMVNFDLTIKSILLHLRHDDHQLPLMMLMHDHMQAMLNILTQ